MLVLRRLVDGRLRIPGIENGCLIVSRDKSGRQHLEQKTKPAAALEKHHHARLRHYTIPSPV